MQDHFPFFGASFPQTTPTLVGELEALLEDPPRQALWAKALETLRQGYDPTLFGRWEHLGEQYEALMARLLDSIPQQSPLRLVLGHRVGTWLDEVMESLYHDVSILDPGMMKHCEPGNICRLPRSLKHIENAYDEKTTQVQLNRVEAYLKKLKNMPTHPGPDRANSPIPPTFPDKVREAYKTLLNAPDARSSNIIADNMANVLHKHKRTFERWLKSSTGYTWKPFKKLLLRWIREAPALTWEQFKMTC